MTISNANAAKINKMNRASKNVNLGTIIQQLQTEDVTASASTVAMLSASVTILNSACAIHTASLITLSSACATYSASLVSHNVSISQLTSACQAHKVALGFTGVLTVSASNSNASVITIVTGLSSVAGYVLNYIQSGSRVFGGYITNTGGSLVLYGDVTASLTIQTNDKINWMVW